MARARMDGDKRTDEERQQDLARLRTQIMTRAEIVLFAVLDADFRSALIRITQLTSDGNFWAEIVIDEGDINNDRMLTLYEIAEIHSARIALREIRMNQQSFSRVTLWPVIDAD